jgi:alpha-L-fucosidase
MRNRGRLSTGKRALAVAVMTCGVLVASEAIAQTNYQPTEENLKARQEFQDEKFGMFIHWGVYSVLGDGEWVFHDRKLKLDEYNRLPLFFDPQKFDARAWVALAMAAGMKYITITSRHHDGFAMFGRPDGGDWHAYLDNYMDGQLRELLTNYGAIAGIWFDGMWDKPDADWHLAKTYALIHQLQPAALIIPNHHQAPKPGEDVQTFERDLPGQNTAGFNTNYVSDRLPLESCNTLNDSWGFNIRDSKYKSAAELEEMVVRAAGNNSNLLLNIGPMPNGEIQREFATRLLAVGEWLSKYGDSIYGTRGGPVQPAEWGVTTQKGSKVYVHILTWNAPLLALPPLENHVREAHLLLDGSGVEFTQNPNGVVLKVLPPKNDEVDRVVVLTLTREN